MPAGLELKELILSEFQLKNFRLLYHDASDFTESPVSCSVVLEANVTAIVLSKKLFADQTLLYSLETP